jgi:hypothetical protein
MQEADAIQKIADMAVDAAKSATVAIDGELLSLRPLHRPPELKLPRPEPLVVATLAGFAAAVKKMAEDAAEGGILGSPHPEDSIIRVEPGCVSLFGPLHMPTAQRFSYAHARTPVGQALADHRGVEYARDGQAGMLQEEFVIWLSVAFAEEPERARLLRLASEIATDKGVTLEDDGVTQRVSAKAGVRLLHSQAINNPFVLVPYRTFPEIVNNPADLPAATFIFRVGEGPGGWLVLSLHEVDNGAWALEATSKVAEHVRGLLGPEWTVVG